MLFASRAFGDAQSSVEQFSALVDIHLDNSGEGQYQAELQPAEKTPWTTLSADLADLLFKIIKLANAPLDVEEHSGLEHPDRLCD